VDIRRKSLEPRVDFVYGTISVLVGIAGIVYLALLPFDITLSDEWDRVIGALVAAFCFAYATYKLIRFVNRLDESPRVASAASDPENTSESK
jgi:hypothetical protein